MSIMFSSKIKLNLFQRRIKLAGIVRVMHWSLLFTDFMFEGQGNNMHPCNAVTHDTGSKGRNNDNIVCIKSHFILVTFSFFLAYHRNISPRIRNSGGSPKVKTQFHLIRYSRFASCQVWLLWKRRPFFGNFIGKSSQCPCEAKAVRRQCDVF